MSFRRILGVTLLALLCLAAVGAVTLGVRRHSQGNELREALAGTPEDAAWVASLPQVDEALRERAWKWMKTKWPTGQRHFKPEERNWHIDGKAPPAKVREQHEAERPHMERLAALLAPGAHCFSSVAWFNEDRNTPDQFGSKHIPNLLSSRCAMRWYEMEAMLVDDPLPVLAEMDRFLEAHQPAGSLIEALIVTALASARDRTYVLLAYRGALPDEVLERWLTEPCRALDWHADGYRGERLGWCEPMARAILEDAPGAKGAIYGDSIDAGEELDYQWHARRDGARLIKGWRLSEGYLDGTVEAKDLEVIEAWRKEGGRIAEMCFAHHDAMVWSLVHAKAQHRMHRLLARTLRMGSRAPESEAELRSVLAEGHGLDGVGRFQMSIRYERVAADRVRFYVPKDTPLPALIEDDRTQHRFAEMERKKWQRTTTLTSMAGLAIEARLPR